MDSNKSARTYSLRDPNTLLIDSSLSIVSIALALSTIFSFNPFPVKAEGVKLDDRSVPKSNQIKSIIRETIPVGIIVGDKLVEPSVLVRGSLDNLTQVSDWLIPWDLVLKTLKFEQNELPNGQLELKSPGLVLRLDTKTVTKDSQLGKVISVKKIEHLLQVPVKFDQSEFALVFEPSWSNLTNLDREESSIVLDRLPVISAPTFAVGGIKFSTTLTGNSDEGKIESQGSLKAVGTALQGSWYVGMNQAKLTEPQSWELTQLQYFRQSDRADYIFGFQPAFWQRAGYWGISTIQRWGFSSDRDLEVNSLNLQSRLQPKQITRTISGKALPKTFVRLVERSSNRSIAEQLVDDSGVYRFQNVLLENNLNNYDLLLYAEGNLTSTPEIRKLGKNNLAGLLSRQNRALIASVGWRANSQDEDNFHSSDGFQGGLSYRQAISDNLTLGVGAVYDRSMLPLGEIFYQPAQIPLQIGFSALTNFDNKFELISSIDFQPSSNLQINFVTTASDRHFFLNWEALSNLTFLAKGSWKNSNLETGLQYSFYKQDFSAFGQFTIDTAQRLRWRFYTKKANWEFQQLGMDKRVSSQLDYKLFNSRQSLSLEHDRDSSKWLTTLLWSYRSNYNASDRGLPWRVAFGYGIGTKGRGIIASVSTSILPEVDLRGRYQQVSLNSNRSDFRLELVPHFSPQNKLLSDSQSFNGLYRQGGILIQPFLDRNSNGLRDRDEELILEEPDLLLVLNNRALRTFRYQVADDGILVTLPPNFYRLDLDPAGFPLDWQAKTKAYALEVKTGAYTLVPIPLTISYTIIGSATDSEGKLLAGVQVKAIPSQGNNAVFSITNTAGIFVLENLEPGNYKFTIQNKPTQPEKILLDSTDETFQELNLQIK